MQPDLNGGRQLPPHIYISVDPGKTTGYCVYAPDTQGAPDFQAGEMPWFEFLHWYHLYLMNKGGLHRTVLICESYTVTAETLKKSRQYWSLEAIGVLRYLSRVYGQDPVVMQSPSSAKSFATRDKLDKIGWWVPGSDHAQDAARHMLVYCINNQLLDPSDLLD